MSATEIGPMGTLQGVLTNIVAQQANLLILHPKVTPVFYGERKFSHLLLSICVIESTQLRTC